MKLILNNFNKPMIVVVPSKKEIMGLVVNEIRKLNKDNILVVANNINGLREQVEDLVDGIIVDVDNINGSARKIKNVFNKDAMRLLNINAQERLKKDYNFVKNFTVDLTFLPHFVQLYVTSIPVFSPAGNFCSKNLKPTTAPTDRINVIKIPAESEKPAEIS